MTGIPYREILVLVLGSLSTYLIWRVQYQKDRLKNIESQLSDKKYKMYSQLIYLLFDLAKNNKLNKVTQPNELVEIIYDIKRDMYLYAPDVIFKKFTEWLVFVSTNPNTADHFNIYYDLIKLIRKDMGNLKTNISRDDFMLFYMQNKDEYEKFKIENGWK